MMYATEKTLATNLLFSIADNAMENNDMIDNALEFYMEFFQFCNLNTRGALYYQDSNTSLYVPEFIRIGTMVDSNKVPIKIKVSIIDKRFSGSVIYDKSEAKLLAMKTKKCINMLKEKRNMWGKIWIENAK